MHMPFNSKHVTHPISTLLLLLVGRTIGQQWWFFQVSPILSPPHHTKTQFATMMPISCHHCLTTLRPILHHTHLDASDESPFTHTTSWHHDKIAFIMLIHCQSVSRGQYIMFTMRITWIMKYVFDSGIQLQWSINEDTIKWVKVDYQEREILYRFLSYSIITYLNKSSQ